MAISPRWEEIKHGLWYSYAKNNVYEEFAMPAWGKGAYALMDDKNKVGSFLLLVTNISIELGQKCVRREAPTVRGIVWKRNIVRHARREHRKK